MKSETITKQVSQTCCNPKASESKKEDKLREKTKIAAKKNIGTNQTDILKPSNVGSKSDNEKTSKNDKVYTKLTTKDVLGMISKDRVLWYTIGVVALSILAVVASNPVTIGAAAVGIGIIGALAYLNRQEIEYQLSSNLSLFKSKFNLLKYTWFEKADDNIILGGIPLKNHNHLGVFRDDLDVDTVVCLTDSFELTEDTLTQRPVRPEEWDTIDVKFKHFPTRDFCPVPIEVIHDAANYINEQLTRLRKKGSNKNVYLHCKAGVGRTPTVYAGYLIEHKGMSAKEALEEARRVRPSINMSKGQIARVYEYEAFIKGLYGSKEASQKAKL